MWRDPVPPSPRGGSQGPPSGLGPSCHCLWLQAAPSGRVPAPALSGLIPCVGLAARLTEGCSRAGGSGSQGVQRGGCAWSFLGPAAPSPACAGLCGGPSAGGPGMLPRKPAFPHPAREGLGEPAAAPAAGASLCAQEGRRPSQGRLRPSFSVLGKRSLGLQLRRQLEPDLCRSVPSASHGRTPHL